MNPADTETFTGRLEALCSGSDGGRTRVCSPAEPYAGGLGQPCAPA